MRTKPSPDMRPDTRAAAPTTDVNALADVLRGRRVVVLCGAGCSTESGIPDYRGQGSPRRAGSPIQYQQFVKQAAARTRYWARSSVGWPRLARARPNTGHRALARLEAGEVVGGVITQNVDGLQQLAGSRHVLELHGSLSGVRCLDCGQREARAALQRRLLASNPGWSDRFAAIAPDGDAELDDEAVRAFRVPGCRCCAGVLKPDVVFFGESVPRERVQRAWTLFYEADALLVAGSSLVVYSGRRFVQRAERDGIPVAIVNLGPTRADQIARVRVEGRTGTVLPRLADLLLDGG